MAQLHRDENKKDYLEEKKQYSPVMDAPKTSFFSKHLAKPISYFIFILWTIITVLPLVWMLYSSFKSNEELVSNIYSLPNVLFHGADVDYMVINPDLNTVYPKGFLESAGIKNAKQRTEIAKKVLILEHTKVGGKTKIMLQFLLRDDIPDDCLLPDGTPVKTAQAGTIINGRDLPKSFQSKFQWSSIWWNYTTSWDRGEFGRGFANSIIYTVVSTFLVVILGLMLGYGTTKFKFKKAAAFIAAAVGLGYLLDINQLIIPLFLMLSKMGLTDTHIGIILVYTAFGLPMSVMLSSTYIKGLPNSLVESAYIDGATPFRTFLAIIVPMTVPVIVTISIMTALSIWNEFLLVLVMASKESTKSLPVGVYSFSSRTGTQLGWQIAALVIATIPVLIVYFIFQKNLAEGVAGGAIKE